MPKRLLPFATGLILGLATVARAGAQQAGDATRSEQPTTAKPAPVQERDPEADIVEKLLTSGDVAEEDLAWLFSDADEYSPSDLTGDPIRAPALPERGEGSPRSWDPRWRKFGTFNYVLTGGGLIAAGASALIKPRSPPWEGRNSFDEWGRDHIKVSDYENALWARDVSDVLVSVNLTFPLLVDSLIVTYWYRRSSEVAGQMALITAEVVAVSAAVQGLTSSLTGRARPFVRDCGKTIDAKLSDCLEKDRHRSFFSGHTSNAFAAASVTCSHHARHAVFGDPVADGLTCATAMGSATTVGLMRVVGGRHYLSDVLTGAAVGSLIGFGVPWLFHYGAPARTSAEPEAPTAVSVTLLPMPNGVSVGGYF